MGKLCFGIVATLLLLLMGLSIDGIAQNPVVVELFTSEGCSSCPPADAVLLQLSQQKPGDGVQVILLGEHVDYWNYIGWTDRFSSKQFSERQSEYAKALHAEVYTPQMVIDGQEQFVGNDAADVQSRIAAAAKKPKPAQVSLAWEGNGRLRVSVNSSQVAKADVLLAITEDGLNTQVGKGENDGKTLHHAAVVRQLHPIGEVANGNFEKTVDIARQSDWNTAKLKAAVLVQDSASKKILGAGSVAFSQ
jgi:hypothetical protein